MKISLAWVFDHINADYTKVDVKDLINRFNQVVAEIEGFQKISLDLSSLTLAEITQVQSQGIQAQSPEWSQTITLPAHKNAQVGSWYVIKKTGSNYAFATMQDFGAEKDSLLPAFKVDSTIKNGSWKKKLEQNDYILEVDNKSITHRPDMWGHRGFACEIAALLGYQLKPLKEFIVEQKVNAYDDSASASTAMPIALNNKAQPGCKRIAATYLAPCAWQESDLYLASRLARIDAKPIDLLVDLTNYVMFDIGQPLHAFDANIFANKQLVVRYAKNKEKITLLDDQTVELTEHDLVITDGTEPLGLAGVMGGAHSGISKNTQAVLVEGAWFDPATIRRTSVRYKKRTEASARFEKNLDPNQNITALERFAKLATAFYRDLRVGDIVSLGKPAEPATLSISHEFIEKRIGVTILPEFIVKTLTALGFSVTVQGGTYQITVPTNRSTKDVKIKEDIVEEIGRFFGYTTLKTELPALQLKPAQLDWLYQQRAIKNLLSYGCQAQEVANYAFYDEEFLQLIKWQAQTTLEVESPVSENWRRLVGTLIPGLLKNIFTNYQEYDVLRFYELARIWTQATLEGERKSLAGIFYDKKSPVDFYEAKAQIQEFLDQLGVPVSWEKVTNAEYPWYAPYQTAYIMHQGTKIGVAGVVPQSFLGSWCLGHAFIFEFDANFLTQYKKPISKYVPESKYPDMVRDISILIAKQITAEQITNLIAKIDPKITSVTLVDFFEKDQWPDQKAMTFRFVIQDATRTMTKEEADAIWDKTAAALKKLNATIR